MRFDNAESVKAMIHAQFGISMLPMWTVAEEIARRTLFLIRQKEPPLLSHIAILTRTTDYLPDPVRAFIKTARAWKWRPKWLRK